MAIAVAYLAGGFGGLVREYLEITTGELAGRVCLCVYEVEVEPIVVWVTEMVIA